MQLLGVWGKPPAAGGKSTPQVVFRAPPRALKGHLGLQDSSCKKAPSSGKVFFDPLQPTRGATSALADPMTLPAGWEARTDPQSGRTYYQNNLTKATQWEPPGAPPPPPPPHAGYAGIPGNPGASAGAGAAHAHKTEWKSGSACTGTWWLKRAGAAPKEAALKTAHTVILLSQNWLLVRRWPSQTEQATQSHTEPRRATQSHAAHSAATPADNRGADHRR